MKTRGVLLALAITIVCVGGTVLRVQVQRAIPGFFGYGDPSLYYQMGRGTLHHGWPRLEFIHHVLKLPPAIVHAEDYYEPAFGALLAVAMAVGGESPTTATCVPLVCGIAALLIVAWTARRHGPAVAAAAVALVAFEPWSIYYSGILMKETTVTVVTLVFLEIVRRAVERPGGGMRLGLALGAGVVGAGLVQYESIPILGVAVFVVLVAHRRDALAGYVAGAVAGTLLLAGVTWWTLGVPISAKYLWFVQNAGFGGGAAASPGERLLRALPLQYVLTASLTGWYPLLAVLAWLGARGLPRTERTLLLAFTLAHLWIHGMPRDLWPRDFIVLTAVLAVPAARALARREAWSEHRSSVPLAGAAVGFCTVAPLLLAVVVSHAPWLTRAGLAGPLAFGAMLAAVFAIALLGVARTTAARALCVAMPVVVTLALAGTAWTLLPWPVIGRNPQFPDYEIVRARRERVGAWMRGSLPPGPVLTSNPAELSLYSGLPAVVMPWPRRADELSGLAVRYQVRWLMAEPGEVSDSLASAMHLKPFARREGCTIFGF
jgi:hypothetical protein